MEYERTMALMNRNLDAEIETIFLMAREEYAHISSSLLRQVAVLEGDLNRYLPEEIREPLRIRAKEKSGGAKS